MLSKQLDSVHKTIIDIHREFFDESPSPMKVQKLCYYAEGINLGEGNEPLFPEDFKAWEHGPVIGQLYHEYKEYKWKPIDKEFEYTTLPEETIEFLEEIVSSYGRYDGAALSTMTHRESPWIDARKQSIENGSPSVIITKDIMRTFFSGNLKTLATK